MRTIKILLAAGFLLVFGTSIHAQVQRNETYLPKFAIKTNALYWATSTPNLGIEVGLAKKLTISSLETLTQKMGGMDILIICAGTGELNPELSYQLEEPTLLTNVIGFTNIADWGFRYFEQQKSGHLVTISSVGGTRGSGIAPAYNASKAYQINYMEGLRQKATKSPYSIYTTDIRPGFVDTAMAKGEGLFWVTPVDKAVKQIKKAISKKKKVAFISKRWRYVTILFRLLPSAIYCRM